MPGLQPGESAGESCTIEQLERELAGCLRTDRFRFRRQLRRLRQGQPARGKRKPADGATGDRGATPDKVQRELTRLARQIAESKQLCDQRRSRPVKLEWDEELPITSRREEIAAAIRENPVVVICGETGSGKSTQLPKICMELGRGIDATIGHTQPRRIAARSVAARVAEEVGTSTGDVVGFRVRFADATSPLTRVKLMTDGILLAETQGDRFLDRYDTLIIDEAHERSLNIDFLLGILRRLLEKRKDLKVIITSATLDAEKFSRHFTIDGRPAPVIEVSGRSWPVDVLYRPLDDRETPDGEPIEPDLQESIFSAVCELAEIGPGDMLVFLPTEREIRETAASLRGRRIPGDHAGRETEILPLYGRLSVKEQNRVFQPHPHRRIVLATNVAESSLTVPGIYSVIDPGTARISRWSTRSGVQRLPIEPVSQASARQRAGRCGRIGPGTCIRLYSEEDFASREEWTPPEILRTNLASVILQTHALGLGAVEEFPFIDPPRPAAIRAGYRVLLELGALDDDERLTERGRQMSRMPVDPRIARMVLAGIEEGCLPAILVIASFLEVQDPRERPLDKQQAADAAHAQFEHPDSDFLGCLRLWQFYHHLREKLSRNQLRKACGENFLSANRLREWADVYRQLAEVVRGLAIPVTTTGEGAPAGRENTRPSRRRGRQNSSGGQETAGQGTSGGLSAKKTGGVETLRLPPGDLTVPPEKDPVLNDQADAIHRALMTGLLGNLALKGEGNEYTGAGGQKFMLWPGSALFSRRPKWVMAAELVETTRRYARVVARINPDWIEPLAGHLVKRTWGDPWWEAERRSAVTSERVVLYGLPIVPRRVVRYGRINPERARELFLQHALVEGDFETKGRFLARNRELIEQIEQEQARRRRMDLLAGEEARFAFYDARVPLDVTDGASFEKWRKQAEQANPGVLVMQREDVVNPDVKDLDDREFPSGLQISGMTLPLSYHLEPGDERDGITLTVPQEGLNQLAPERLGWLVPGLLEQKIVALIRSLPKAKRRMFVPAPDTARDVMARLTFGQGDMLAEVARTLTQLSGEPLERSEFQESELPRHLRMNVQVVGADGEELAQDRDLRALRRQFGQAAAASFTAANDSDWNRDGIREWTLDALPETVTVERGGVAMTGYPALTDAGDSAALRVFDSAERAAQEMRTGLRRLFLLQCGRGIRQNVRSLPGLQKLALLAAAIPDLSLEEDLVTLIADRAWFQGEPLPANEAAFRNQLKLARGRIGLAVQDVAELLPQILETGQAVRMRLSRAKKTPKWKPAVDDMRSQLQHLLHATFLTTTPWEWLVQFPRYLQGIETRLDRLEAGGIERDSQMAVAVVRRWQQCLAAQEHQREQAGYDAALEYFRWMVEEYRVSLFAQKLGTAITVSEKRLDRQWKKVDHG